MIFMNRHQIGIFLFSICLSSQIWSAPCEGPGCDDKTWAKVISLSVGPVWGGHGKTHHFSRPTNDPLEVLQQNQFTAAGGSSVFGSGEAFFALQKPVYPGILGRLGLAIAFSGDAEMRGDVRLFVNSNSAGYKYNLSQTRVAVKGLLATDYPNWFVQPYISGSVGIGFNNSSKFRTNPSILLTGPVGRNQVFQYADNTTNGFTYTVGIGVQKSFTPNWQVGMGYEFADWGKNALDPTLLFPFNYSTPNMSHYYTHAVQLTLSYIC